MMFSNKFVVAIKANGKVLREHGDLVKLPFGTEFSVLVKNLNSRRAKFSIDIDGADALDGTEIIVNANSETEIKRFIRNGNMDEGNAFKFIERTAAIEDGPRGIKVDDGIVRVEFTFEQEAPIYTTTYHRDVWDSGYYRTQPWYSLNNTIGGSLSATTSTTNYGEKMKSVRSANADSAPVASYSSTVANGITQNASLSSEAGGGAAPMSASINEVGITVPGSKVDQKFTTVYGFRAEAQSHVIILRIAGTVGNVEVVAPVTVKAKQKCVTCGLTNKATSKFCSSCGTALELL